MEDFLRYWDEAIRRWADDGAVVPESEKCWFLPESSLHRVLMPEPYWGSPYSCSAVLLNYNPGGCDGEPQPDDNCHINNVKNNDIAKMSGATHNCYSKIALEFPWLDDNSRQDFTLTPSHLPTKRFEKFESEIIDKIKANQL